jgi:dienelactone hydrolase
MRLFESLILFTLLLTLAWPLFPAGVRQDGRLVRLRESLPALSLILLLPHFILEGARWQMLPVYLMVILVAGLAAWRRFRPGSAAGKVHSTSRLLAAGGLVLWLLAAALPILLPVPRLPEPGGPFAVGTFTHHLVDAGRPDPYSEPPNQPREIMLQVWYPAPPDASGETAPYADRLDIAAPALAEQLDFPAFFLDHLQLVETHAIISAPLASTGEALPVLLFSHGLSGFRSQNTIQMESLASHGYVVVAPDYTHAAAMTVLPPNRVRLYNNDVVDMSSDATTIASGKRLVEQWVADLEQIMGQLEEWNGGGHMLSGRLDLEKAGLFGHSTGAGATLQFCHQDSRCGAAAFLDGWFDPASQDALFTPLEQPIIMVQQVGGFGGESNRVHMRDFFNDAAADVYRIDVNESTHYDFTDIPMLSPITSLLGLTGNVPGRRMVTLVDDYTRQFFDQSLRGTPAPLLSLANDEYPEVNFYRGSEQ